MDLKVVLLSIVTILNLVLGIFIFLKNKKSPTNIFYSILSLSLAVWSFGMLMYAKDPIDIPRILLWSKVLYFAGSMVATSFLCFSLVFPSNRWNISSHKKLLIFIPNIIILVMLFFSDIILKEVVIYPNNRQLVHGYGYIFYFLHFFGYFIWAYVIIFKNYLKSSGILRTQFKYILVGTIIPAAFCGIINMILPAFGNFRLAWYGPLILFFMVGFISYAILKHQLMNIKVIATELFVFVIVLFSFVQIFLTRTTTEIIVKAAFFIGVLLIGIFLVRSVIKVKELDEAKSEFLSIASHQLRTPLSFIKGNVSMTLEGTWGKLTPGQKMELEKVYISNERLIKLVDDLLDISRIESGRMEYSFESVSLEEMAENMVKDFLPMARMKNLDLKYERPEKPLSKVKADSLKIRQVIMNLIDNAIKYTEEGRITIGLKEKDNKVIFWVKDTGIGIAPGEQKLLFQKFSRVTEATKTKTEGLGIGLYLGAELIKAHKGKIWVESEGERKGSTFYFELPVEKDK